jgi:hypothetical protein
MASGQDLIHAFTSATAGSYPPYVNITRLEDGTVDVTVRSPRKPDGDCGDSGRINLSRAEYEALLADMNSN